MTVHTGLVSTSLGTSRDAAALTRFEEIRSRFEATHRTAAFWLCENHDPERVAYKLVHLDGSASDLTYCSLSESSQALANGLAALGVRAGSRVATFMGKSREYLETVLAIWRLGAVHVPIFTAFARPAVEFRLVNSHASVCVCDAAQAIKLINSEHSEQGALYRIVTTGPPSEGMMAFNDVKQSAGDEYEEPSMGSESPFIQLFTSGATGNPKGVNVPISALASFFVYAEIGLGLRPDDVFWNAADPGWAYGLYYGIVTTLLTGVTGILAEGGFSPQRTMDVLHSMSVTNFAGAPTIYRSLREARVAAPGPLKIRNLSSAGEPLTHDVNKWAIDTLGVPVYDHYGQTENGIIIGNLHHPDFATPLKPGSMGRALPGLKAVILQMDQDDVAPHGILGRAALDRKESPSAWFTGYIGNGPESTKNGFSTNGQWYITGDLAYRDQDGDFFFSSREDDVIIMAGYRIAPVEIEQILSMHPAVCECAAIASPDSIRGEVLEAVVVVRDGFAPGAVLTKELQDHVKKNFAAHAYPRQIHYRTSLPRTPSGKLQRFVLRDEIAKDQGPEANALEKNETPSMA